MFCLVSSDHGRSQSRPFSIIDHEVVELLRQGGAGHVEGQICSAKESHQKLLFQRLSILIAKKSRLDAFVNSKLCRGDVVRLLFESRSRHGWFEMKVLNFSLT